MNLTPKQIATQEAMLLRLYPGKSLEEAKEEEAIHDECFLICNIIGLPPTLPRVLDALRSHSIRRCDFLGEKYDCVYIRRSMHGVIGENIERKLRNDDGTDATLRDQDIQTQDAVSRLLGVE